MPIEITILPEDVETAIEYKLKKAQYTSWSSHCPIAEAVHRTTGADYDDISISGGDYAWVLRREYKLPESAQDYIQQVDHFLHPSGEGFDPTKVEAGKTFILEDYDND